MISQTDAGPGSWVIVAHGAGPGLDLPIPLFYAVAGGALAVFVSFLAMAVVWPESRLRDAYAGRPAVRLGRLVDASATRGTLRAFAIALTVVVVVARLSGPGNTGSQFRPNHNRREGMRQAPPCAREPV